MAAQNGHIQCMRHLIAHGADIRSQTILLEPTPVRCPYGNEPLHLAAQYGQVESLQFLLANGADITAIGRHRYSALAHAVVKGMPEAAKVLLAWGADVSDAPSLQRAASLGFIDIANDLINNGEDPNCVSPNGWTALRAAVCGGHISAARLLLESGGYVDPVDADGMTPLHYAAAHGQQKLIELLVAKGASIKKRNGQGHSPAQAFEVYVAKNSWMSEATKNIIRALLAEKAPTFNFSWDTAASPGAKACTDTVKASESSKAPPKFNFSW